MEGYARTAEYEYLRACERFGMAPWGGEDAWGAAELAGVMEFCRVRELEERQ